MLPLEQLDLWPDEVDALPWGGRSPRLVVQRVVDQRIREFLKFSGGPGGVDNLVVGCPSREAQRIGTDPAQLSICIADSF